ncbi:hypothetical protein SAMN03159355_04529 [Pseudomonas sp. NFPP10]|nr:hypothetical protein SAMN03159465_05559 [Pseudomonas sp. NFPP12]SEM27782.1 hypothetical protein SAMN03159355_04529 [Pseudomonas sp. NFPP10]SFK08415.1 hypothetical protein SAMN03159416_04945 [Pseudomonas sp. NFPP08]SFN26368.1 hypothetical protein SAMN03159476_04576 [Pseudomonas sp. NFPP05]SFX96355.1 hypothetical protein SAMN03159479_05094 [Pseudomonas sp. NFPP09]
MNYGMKIWWWITPRPSISKKTLGTYHIVRKGRTEDLRKIDFDKLREEFTFSFCIWYIGGN